MIGKAGKTGKQLKMDESPRQEVIDLFFLTALLIASGVKILVEGKTSRRTAVCEDT